MKCLKDSDYGLVSNRHLSQRPRAWGQGHVTWAKMD